MKIRQILSIGCFLWILASLRLAAQQPEIQPLPIDPKIRYGQLNNGRPMEAKGSMEARGGISLKTGGRGVAAGKSRPDTPQRGRRQGDRPPCPARHG